MVTIAALIPVAAILDMLILKALFSGSVDTFANTVIVVGAAWAVAVSTALGVVNLIRAKERADEIKRDLEEALDDNSEEYFDSEETA